MYAVIVGDPEFLKGSPYVSGEECKVGDKCWWFESRGKLFWFAFCKDEFSKVCHISKAKLREEIYSSKFL